MNSKILLVTVIFLLAMTTACGSAAIAAPTQGSSALLPAATGIVAPDSTATLAATDTLMPTSIPATATVELPAPSNTVPAPAGSANSSGGFPTGSFKPNHPVHIKNLVFNQDGTYQMLGIVEAGQTAAVPVGTYTVSGDHVTFLESAASVSVCQKDSGEYSWSFNGSALVFQMVNDNCDERRIDLTNSTWTKQP